MRFSHGRDMHGTLLNGVRGMGMGNGEWGMRMRDGKLKGEK